ncbi:unnamed protein product, partial [Mesorhabditis spiculigera]
MSQPTGYELREFPVTGPPPYPHPPPALGGYHQPQPGQNPGYPAHQHSTPYANPAQNTGAGNHNKNELRLRIDPMPAGPSYNLYGPNPDNSPAQPPAVAYENPAEEDEEEDSGFEAGYAHAMSQLEVMPRLRTCPRYLLWTALIAYGIFGFIDVFVGYFAADEQVKNLITARSGSGKHKEWAAKYDRLSQTVPVVLSIGLWLMSLCGLSRRQVAVLYPYMGAQMLRILVILNPPAGAAWAEHCGPPALLSAVATIISCSWLLCSDWKLLNKNIKIT